MTSGRCFLGIRRFFAWILGWFRRPLGVVITGRGFSVLIAMSSTCGWCIHGCFKYVCFFIHKNHAEMLIISYINCPETRKAIYWRYMQNVWRLMIFSHYASDLRTRLRFENETRTLQYMNAVWFSLQEPTKAMTTNNKILWLFYTNFCTFDWNASNMIYSAWHKPKLTIFER